MRNTLTDPNATVLAYYTQTHWVYQKFWYSPEDLGLHYGYWDAHTRSHREAALTLNRFLAEKAEITSEDYVLDAGCGVGGTSIWLAQTIGCRVRGITIVPVQLTAAVRNTEKRGISSDQVSYELKDYLNTDYAEDTFDVVVAIESFCHAPNKTELFTEMRRILKPGGRMIVADGFQNRIPQERREEKIFERFIQGLAVPQTQWLHKDIKLLQRIGFTDIQFWDITEAIRPSANRILYKGVLFSLLVPGLYVLRRIQRVDSTVERANWRAAFAQWRALRRGLWCYYVYRAKKASQ